MRLSQKWFRSALPLSVPMSLSLSMSLSVALVASTVACNKVSFNYTGAEIGKSCEVAEAGCDQPHPPSTPPPDDSHKYKSYEEDVDVNTTTKIDILFVIDSSASMNKERAELGRRLGAFISKLSKLDWRVCVTTTDADNDRGALLPFGNGEYALHPDTVDAQRLFANRIVSITQGSGDEQGIHAMGLAFERNDSRCFRPDAALSSIVLSDEDEFSTGGYDEFRRSSQFKELKPWNYPSHVLETVFKVWSTQKIFTAHSIVIRSGDKACYDEQKRDSSEVFYGTRYEQLSQMSNGVIGDICAADYTDQLQDFAERIESSTASVPMQCEPVEDPEVEIIPRPPGLKIKRDKGKLTFVPALKNGTKLKMKYKCKK